MGLVVVAGWLATGCQTARHDINFSSVPGDESTATPDKSVSEPATNKTDVAKVSESPSGGPFGLNSDRFAIGDLVRVTFSGVTDPIQPHEERIKDDGSITLPLIGAIKAVGKTPGDVQKAITSAYVPDYYKRLTVTVTSNQRVYYVGGQVRGPGRQEYLGTTTVTKAIQSAGDFTDFADRRKVILTRADGKKFTVNCLKAAKDPALDLAVFPGDKIEVPMRGLW
jgi:polysaccharide biosynthesis/export protein VpsN